jgi:hypothetical protein
MISVTNYGLGKDVSLSIMYILLLLNILTELSLVVTVTLFFSSVLVFFY